MELPYSKFVPHSLNKLVIFHLWLYNMNMSYLRIISIKVLNYTFLKARENEMKNLPLAPTL